MACVHGEKYRCVPCELGAPYLPKPANGFATFSEYVRIPMDIQFPTGVPCIGDRFLAGGAVLDCIFRQKKPKDYDVFYLNQTALEKDCSYWPLTESKYAFNYDMVGDAYALHVQYIKKIVPSIEQALNEFDIVACKMAFHNGVLIARHDAIRDALFKVLRFEHRRKNYHYRFSRYTIKGYIPTLAENTYFQSHDRPILDAEEMYEW